MSKIIKFKQEEQHSCPNCDLIFEFLPEIIESESHEDLFEVLSVLVSEAKDLGLKEYLIAELNAKAELLDHLEFGDSAECCNEDECDC